MQINLENQRKSMKKIQDESKMNYLLEKDDSEKYKKINSENESAK